VTVAKCGPAAHQNQKKKILKSKKRKVLPTPSAAPEGTQLAPTKDTTNNSNQGPSSLATFPTQQVAVTVKVRS
jgi:hypothetical protein